MAGRYRLPGWAGWPRPARLAAALGLLALGLALGLDLAARQWRADALADAAQARQQSAQQRVETARAAAAHPTLTAARTDPAAAWRDALPAPAAHADRTAALVALAQAQGVRVLSLRQSSTGEHGLHALGVTMQAEGSYPALRRLVALALQADLALVLTSLRLQRADSGSALLAADLGWVQLTSAPPVAERAATR